MSIGNPLAVQRSMYPHSALAYTANAKYGNIENQHFNLVNDSKPGNRLIENPDGSLGIISKTPAEVFGEKVLRPMLDQATSFGGRVFSILKNGGSYFDQTLTRMMQIFPGVSASETGQIAFFEKKCPEGWEDYLPAEGRFIIGSGVYQNTTEDGRYERANYTSGDIGGEIQHKLTQGEMPRHSHSIFYGKILGNNPFRDVDNRAFKEATFYSGRDGSTGQTGKSSPHNNMPPYIALKACKKTGETFDGDVTDDRITNQTVSPPATLRPKYSFKRGDEELFINRGNNDAIKLGVGIENRDIYFQKGDTYSTRERLYVRFHSNPNDKIVINGFFSGSGYIQKPQKIRFLILKNGSSIDLSKPLKLFWSGGTAQSDIYTYHRGNGEMFINEINNGIKSLNDIIKLGAGITKSDVYFQRGGTYSTRERLYVRFYSNPNDKIVINRFFSGDGYIQKPQKIEKIVFDNRDQIDLSQPLDLFWSQGTAQSDIYHYYRGNGEMFINEIANGVYSLNDTIKLGPGITKSDIYFHKGSAYSIRENLYVRFHSNPNDKIVIKAFFYANGHIQKPQKIEKILLNDGSKIDLTKPFRLQT